MRCVADWCPCPDEVDPNDCQYFGGCDFAVAPPTNADRIRAMIDEDLAKLLLKGCAEDVCPDGCDGCDGDCEGRLLKWLRQQAE